VVSVTRASERFDGAELIVAVDEALFRGPSLVDDVHVFAFETQGFGHRYLQPYAGPEPLPGLHLAHVGGAIRQSSILVSDPERQSMWIDADEHPIAALEQDSSLHGLGAVLPWWWDSGLRTFELPWSAQIRPSSAGVSQVVMVAGRHGAASIDGVATAVFLQLCSALHQLTSTSAGIEEAFIAPLSPCLESLM
jgi:hypothetical protein